MFEKNVADIIESEAVINYIRRRKVIYPILDGRLTTIEEDGEPSKAIRHDRWLYNLLLIIAICIKSAF